MDGNITSPGAPNIFPAIAQNLGLDSTVLFLFMGTFVMFPLAYMKAPKMFYPLGFLIYTVLGMNLGIVPFWIPIFAFALTGIITAGEIGKFFSTSIPEPTPLFNFKEFKKSQPEIHRTENCKNCGGPNVDRVTCEWCGLVLE